MKGICVALVIVTVGYFAGSAGRHIPTYSEAKPEVSSPASKPIRRNRTIEVAPSILVSTDTVETLQQLPVDQLYHCLALWLLDAPAPEIQEFWTWYSQLSDRSGEIEELLLIGWAGVDPESAITNVKESAYGKGPWWAWACHEPERALDEVRSRFRSSENQEPIAQVLRGIGEFHPKWLRENIDDLPDKWMRDEALAGYLKRTDTENPLESVLFLQERGVQIPVETLLALGLQDPVAAHSLAMKTSVEKRGPDFNHRFMERLASGNPAAVDVLLARTTSPRERMLLRLKQFEIRMEADPSAMEQTVRDLPASWLRDGGLAVLANHYLESDPAKAVDFTAEILLQPNYQPGQFSKIHRERGGSDPKKLAPSPAKPLVDHLVRESPAELMAAITPEDGFPTAAYREVVTAWADHNAAEFAEWARDVEQPFTYVVAAGEVTARLLADKQYPEAMEWAESIPAATGRPSYHLADVYGSWVGADPEGAQSWRDKAQLSEAQKWSLARFDK